MHPISAAGNIKFTGIYNYQNESDTKESYFSIGFEYQRDLIEDLDKRGYFTIGIHIDNQISNSVYFSKEYNRSSFFRRGLGGGVGLGFNF